jgi:hypothetical protein
LGQCRRVRAGLINTAPAEPLADIAAQTDADLREYRVSRRWVRPRARRDWTPVQSRATSLLLRPSTTTAATPGRASDIAHPQESRCELCRETAANYVVGSDTAGAQLSDADADAVPIAPAAGG